MTASVALTPESETSLATLRRALARSSGLFSFHLVICSGVAREETIAHLRTWSGTGGVPAFTFIPESRASSTEAQRWLTEIGAEQPLSGLVLTDGDALTWDHATVTSFNMVRDKLAQLVAGPLALLISAHGARVLQQSAPDLFDVRAGSYSVEAVVPRGAPLLLLTENPPRPVSSTLSTEDIERLEASAEPPPPTALADAWFKLANHLKAEGRFEEAATAAQKTLQWASAAKTPYFGAQISALGLLAEMAIARRNMPQAYAHIVDALRVSEMTDLQNLAGIAQQLRNFSQLLNAVGSSDEVTRLKEQVLVQLNETAGKVEKIDGALGLLLKQFHEMAMVVERVPSAEALGLFAEGVQNIGSFGSRVGDPNGAARILAREAGSLAKGGHTQTALMLLQEEERIRQASGDAEGLATNVANQALIHERHGQLESARNLAEQAEQIATERGHALFLQNLRPLLERLLGSTGALG